MKLLDDPEIRDIVSRWFPPSDIEMKEIYNNDICELARDFGFHIAAKQSSNIKSELKKIMTEAGDLKTLEKMIADYISEDEDVQKGSPKIHA